jgi:hypothetical protein
MIFKLIIENKLAINFNLIHRDDYIQELVDEERGFLKENEILRQIQYHLCRCFLVRGIRAYRGIR